MQNNITNKSTCSYYIIGGMETGEVWKQVWCACCRVRVRLCRGSSEVGGLRAGWGRLWWCRRGRLRRRRGEGGSGDDEVASASAGSVDLQQGEQWWRRRVAAAVAATGSASLRQVGAGAAS